MIARNDTLKTQNSNILNKTLSDNISTHLQSSLKFYKSGKKQKAQELLKSLLEYNPNIFEANQLLGVINLEECRYQEAVLYFKNAIQLNFYDASCHSNIGYAYYELKDLEQSEEHHKIALSMQPHNPDFLYNYGLTKSERNQLDEALQLFETALHIQPKYFRSYDGIGSVLVKKYKLNAAIIAFDKALEINKIYEKSLKNKAHCQYRLRLYDEVT